MKKTITAFLVLACALSQSFAQKDVSVISDDFIAYMKSVMNPFDYGLNPDDGRYYPYSSRYGRRIAFDAEVEDKALFAKGMSAEDANRRLCENLKALVGPLAEHLKKNYGVENFDALSVVQREILLDRAYDYGISELPRAFVEVVLKADWKRMFGEMLYVRQPEGWPDAIKNKAFGRRWIYNPQGGNLYAE